MHPKILYWKWDDSILDRQIFTKKLKDIVNRCSFDVIAVSPHDIQNIDLTIIAQQPKISPYIANMKQKLCQKLKISENQINIKATTEEGLGFTGREEGISSHCVVLLN